MNDQRNLLLVTTEAVDDGVLRAAVRRHVGENVARVRVIAPVSKVSPLEWLTNDEDAKRAEAQEVADHAAEAVGDMAPADAEIGDSDPVQAVEDALREFPADEILMVIGPKDERSWLEQGSVSEAIGRFGVPVKPLVVSSEKR